MACELITHGYADDCQNNVGGIKALYIFNYGVIGTQPTANYATANPDTADQLNTITLTPQTTPFYKYELKGANSFEQTITSSRENGTTFVEQTLTFTTKGLSATQTKQMKLLAWGRPTIMIQTFSNKFLIAGLENGMDVETTLISNGTAMGDLVGYTITMKGQEIIPANHVNILSPFGTTQILNVVGVGSSIVTN
jgi:hypothetical protein